MALEDHLLTESLNPRSESIDTLTPVEIVRLMNSEDARVVAAVGEEAESIAQAIEWAAPPASAGRQVDLRWGRYIRPPRCARRR